VLAILRDDNPIEPASSEGRCFDLIRDLLFRMKKAYQGLRVDAIPAPGRKSYDLIQKFYGKGTTQQKQGRDRSESHHGGAAAATYLGPKHDTRMTASSDEDTDTKV